MALKQTAERAALNKLIDYLDDRPRKSTSTRSWTS